VVYARIVAQKPTHFCARDKKCKIPLDKTQQMLRNNSCFTLNEIFIISELIKLHYFLFHFLSSSFIDLKYIGETFGWLFWIVLFQIPDSEDRRLLNIAALVAFSLEM